MKAFWRTLLLLAALVLVSVCALGETPEGDYCQACQKNVTWQELTEESAEAAGLPEGHYRLSFSQGSCAWAEKKITGKVCLDLNQMTLQGKTRLFTVHNGGTLSIMGQGTVIGGGFAPETGDADRIGSVAMVGGGGALNLYEGTLTTALFSEENLNSFNGGAIWARGAVNIYGGKIENGIATNAGGNIFIQTGGALQMFGGELTGGSKRDVYCKGTALVANDAVVGVIHMRVPELTVQGEYTGYMVVDYPEIKDGVVIGKSENANLDHARVSVSHQENFFFLVIEGDQLKLSQYQQDSPVKVVSRYCVACDRYADFTPLTEQDTVATRIYTGHYYLDFPSGTAVYGRKKMIQADRVCLDLNGMTLYAEDAAFELDADCVLNIMDTAGGGAISGTKDSGDGPLITVAPTGSCNLYDCLLTGYGDEACCVSLLPDETGVGELTARNSKVGGKILSAGKVTVAGTTEIDILECAAGEDSLLVEDGFSGSIMLADENISCGAAIGRAAGPFAGAVLTANGGKATLRNQTLVAIFGTPGAIVYDRQGQPEAKESLSAAIGAFTDTSEYILLLEDVAADITLDRDIYLDLNGHSVSGAVSGEGIAYCMDSATADFTVADGVYGKITGSDHAQPAEGYLMLTEETGYSFHCVSAQMESMTLRPQNSGIYFTAEFSGDEAVKAQVARFGVMFSLGEDPLTTESPVCRTVFSGEQFGSSQEATSSLIKGILKETLSDEENNERAAAPIYARTYVRMKDGRELIGEAYSRSLQEQVSLVNEGWSTLKTLEKRSLWQMFQRYRSAMSGWSVAALVNVEKQITKMADTDYSSYEIPWEKDAVAEAKADGKIHYYFMSGENLVISKAQSDPLRWGDACLVVFPDGQTMLVDCGPQAYGPVLLRNLQKLGIERLDILLISHPHGDHQSGAFSDVAVLGDGLLNHIEIGKIYWRGGYDPARTDDQWVPEAAACYGIECEVLERGDVAQIGSVRMQVLWPLAGDGDSQISNDLEINNMSLIFRLDYGEHSSLFPGDLYVTGTSGDVLLLNRTEHSLLDVDLLKVPHHGHDTSGSASLLRAVSAELAVATGNVELPEALVARYAEAETELLGDRQYGYIHVSANALGNMSYETSRTQPLSSS